ncbi:MAG: DUF1285 domain-containing protein [Sphingomicrobium sp.]
MTPGRPPIELRGLDFAELQRLADEQILPPVEHWNPPNCGHSGMRITRDGTWMHEGRPIERAAMVHLFATILRREPDGSHVLVTPVEKLVIDVESTAFRVIEMSSEGDHRDRRIAFRLDSGEILILDREHPLRLASNGSGPRILVRHGLEAEIARPVYYELAELAIAEDHDPLGIWSAGAFFALSEPE